MRHEEREPAPSSTQHPRPGDPRAQVLVVCLDPARRPSLEALLGPHVATLSAVADLPPPEACGCFDAVLADLATLSAADPTRAIVPPGTALIAIGDERAAADVMVALRSGALDILDPSQPAEAVAGRIDRACDLARSRAGSARADRRRVADLRRCAMELDRTRTELDRQMGRICAELSAPEGSLSRRVRDVAMASELNTLLRQELEMEGLLRTTLEFAARRIGSSNAAIFLSEPSGEFGLGAYVNYDCPRDTAEDLLEEMAGSLAPRLSMRDGIVLLSTADEVRSVVGTRCAWLDDSAVCALTCRPEGECVGVVVFFRDGRQGFSEADQAAVRVIGALFGRQLARVVRTNSRHKPADAWDTDIAA
jgi:hypothetical protein